jgi:hypothetical protein
VNPRLAAAIQCAEHGWPVLPIHAPDADGRCSCRKTDCASPAKHPRTRHGLKDASTDPATIESWWSMWPSANVAICTGASSGVVVLDADGDAGLDSLYELQREHGQLPPTLTVKTPSGGQHVYLRRPREPVANSVRILGPGLDVRGDGGYVLVPPSLGMSGSRYEVDERVNPAPMPGWLRGLLTAPARAERGPMPSDVWLRMVRDGAEQGTRNDSLARLVGHLLRHHVDVDLTAEIAHLVNAHRFSPPLAVGEVNHIIDSIAGREARRREREGAHEWAR